MGREGVDKLEIMLRHVKDTCRKNSHNLILYHDMTPPNQGVYFLVPSRRWKYWKGWRGWIQAMLLTPPAPSGQTVNKGLQQRCVWTPMCIHQNQNRWAPTLNYKKKRITILSSLLWESKDRHTWDPLCPWTTAVSRTALGLGTLYRQNPCLSINVKKMVLLFFFFFNYNIFSRDLKI